MEPDATNCLKDWTKEWEEVRKFLKNQRPDIHMPSLKEPEFIPNKRYSFASIDE